MSALKVAGHQPYYLPWLGYMDKIDKVDVFCFIDTIPFDGNSFQHRNKIRSYNKEGEEMLTIPVLAKDGDGQLIADIVIDNSSEWRKEHWGKIKASYGEAPYFAKYAEFFEDMYKKDWNKLVDVSEHMIQGLIGFWGLETKLARSSVLGIYQDGEKNMLVALCEKFGAKKYLSGKKCEVLEAKAFEDAGISHEVQQFTHPVYSQVHGEFRPVMAAIDLLFNHGEKALDILRGHE